MITEDWKDIKGYEGYYQISNMGNIRSVDKYVVNNKNGSLAFKKGKPLKPQKQNSGYLYISLSREDKRKNFLIHRLVAEAFIPNPDKLEQVNHKDENKHNNNIENLEWCTQAYNLNYGTAIERRVSKLIGRKVPQEVIDKCIAKRIGTHHSEETKEKIRQALTGLKRSEESLKRISAARKEYYKTHENPNKGRHHNEESKRKMSEAHKEYYKTHEHAQKGIPMTEEQKRKMRKPIYQLTLSGEIIKYWEGLTEAAKALNLGDGNICKCCKDNTKTCGGFKWKYA